MSGSRRRPGRLGSRVDCYRAWRFDPGLRVGSSRSGSTAARPFISPQPRSTFAPCACSAIARIWRPRSRRTSASGSTGRPDALAALRCCATSATRPRRSSTVRLIACLDSSRYSDRSTMTGVAFSLCRAGGYAEWCAGGRRFRLVWTWSRRCPGQRVGLERSPVGARPGPALLLGQAELWRLLRSVARNSGRSAWFDLV
jgi:hypothetical protein